VHVTPRAGKNAIGDERGGALAIRLAAAAVEGAANEALIAYLAQVLDLPKSAVRIAAGEHSRHKRVRIGRLTAAEVRTQLHAARQASPIPTRY
jgi:uncharacterized protein